VIDAVAEVRSVTANVKVAADAVEPVNDRPENVATPDTAATPEDACAPPSVPPDADTVTVAVDVVTFPYASVTLTTGCVDSADPDAPATGDVATTSLLAAPADTATDRRSDPDDEIDPSDTDTVADSAEYSAIDAVTTPLANVSDVLEPIEVPATVGAVTGLDDEPGPENVNDFEPEYPVAVFPAESLAVTVMVWESPAVCDADPVSTNDAAAPGPVGVIDDDVTDVNPVEANVSVRDVVVSPVNVRFVNVAVPDTAATPEDA